MPNKFTSRDFNQRVTEAKKAAQDGPVFITDRGEPKHVLLSIEAYQALLHRAPSIVDLLAYNHDVEFEPPKLGDLPRPAEFD